MTSVFGAACHCGATYAHPAPTLADITDGAAAMARAGWGLDSHGRVQCPICLSAPAPDLAAVPPDAIVEPPPPDPIQGELFS